MAMMNFLRCHVEKEQASFHMPGHKGRAFYEKHMDPSFFDQLIDFDITEVPGADNLFQTEGIIKEVQDNYARLYGVERSYLLINGSSSGIIASILASVSKGEKLIMARNCHKSAFNALTLGGIQPVYAYPDMVEEYGVSGAIPPNQIEELLRDNPDAQAVILPSPNYYGICSDIKRIAEIVHSYGKVLIVDQAHGAHLEFFRKHIKDGGMLPASAEFLGADLVINSTHKTLASFTQSAILNFNSSRVDPYVLEDKLQAIQSTSPSYILMASLEVNASLLENNGKELIENWKNNLGYFYEQAKKIDGLSVMDIGESMDTTKINVDFSSRGISGAQVEELLLDKGIVPELVTGPIVMCMTGIGNTRDDYQLLLDALREIARDYGEIANKRCELSVTFQPSELRLVPEIKKRVPLRDAEGLVCASSIIPYPPGIPLVCPGEVITAEQIRHILDLRGRGEKVIGVTPAQEIFVGLT